MKYGADIHKRPLNPINQYPRVSIPIEKISTTPYECVTYNETIRRKVSNMVYHLVSGLSNMSSEIPLPKADQKGDYNDALES